MSKSKSVIEMQRVLPILFNTDMVRAILDDRKTATRRAIKGYIPDDAMFGYTMFTPKGYISCRGTFADEHGEKFFKLPYQKGDILYVRETWSTHYTAYSNGKLVYCYKADGINLKAGCLSGEWNRWYPSIHMPKEAARIWLKVTDVRVERLHDITEEQAIREGIIRLYDDLPNAEYTSWTKNTGVFPKGKEEWGYKNYLWHGNFGLRGTGNKMSDAWEYQFSSYDSAISSFSSLWNTTLPLKKWNIHGWDANPWVWVIEFERCEKPESEG